MSVEQLVLRQRKAWVCTNDAINALHSRIGLDALHIGIEIVYILVGQHIALRLHRQNDGRGVLTIKALCEQVIRGTRWHTFR